MLRHLVFAITAATVVDESRLRGCAASVGDKAHDRRVRQRSRRTIDIALVTGCRKTDGHPGVGAPH